MTKITSTSSAVTEGKLIILLGTTTGKQYSSLMKSVQALDRDARSRVAVLVIDTVDPVTAFGVPEVAALQARVPRAFRMVFDGEIEEEPELVAHTMRPHRPFSNADGTQGIANDGDIAIMDAIGKLMGKIGSAVDSSLALPSSFATEGMLRSVSVYIEAFIGGGSATGMLFPVLLVLNNVLEQKYVSSTVEAHLILPSAAYPGDSEDIRMRRLANAFAVLLQFEAVRRVGRLALPSRDGPLEWTGPLADQVHLYSNESEAGTICHPDDLPSIATREISLRIRDGYGVGAAIRDQRVRLDVVTETDEQGTPTMFSASGHTYVSKSVESLAEAFGDQAAQEFLRLLWAGKLMLDQPRRAAVEGTLWNYLLGSRPQDDWIEHLVETLNDHEAPDISYADVGYTVTALEQHRRDAAERRKAIVDQINERAALLETQLRDTLFGHVVDLFFSERMAVIQPAMELCARKLADAVAAVPLPPDSMEEVELALEAARTAADDEYETAAAVFVDALRRDLNATAQRAATRAVRAALGRLSSSLEDQGRAMAQLIDDVRADVNDGRRQELKDGSRPVEDQSTPLERPLISGAAARQALYEHFASGLFEVGRDGVRRLRGEVPARVAKALKAQWREIPTDSGTFVDAVEDYWRGWFQQRLAEMAIPAMLEVVHGSLEPSGEMFAWMFAAAQEPFIWLDLGSVRERLTSWLILQAPAELVSHAERAARDPFRAVGGTDELIVSTATHGLRLKDVLAFRKGGVFYKAYKARQELWIAGNGKPVHACPQLEALVRDECFAGDWRNL